jgi:endonuclease/exonuclease/phosphatase family metal-dependent hydrolase
MTRVLSYNILLGGTRREKELATIIHSIQPDIVGLVEATNPHVVEELADQLGMQFCLSGRSRGPQDWNIAVLSKLPIIQTRVHTHPGIFTRRYFLEVELEEASGEHLTVFVTHLTASFFRGMKSVYKRRREVEEILRIMAPRQGTPHLVMGDFNSKTHGEDFQGSALLRYFRSQRAPHSLRPTLSDGKSWVRHTIRRILRLGIYSPFLIPLADRLSRVYAQGGIDLLIKAGYVDCFRQMHPHDQGFTFHTAKPVGRIDYIFASPELALRLTNSKVITEGDGISGTLASDHFPVYAEFVTNATPEQ